MTTEKEERLRFIQKRVDDQEKYLSALGDRMRDGKIGIVRYLQVRKSALEVWDRITDELIELTRPE